MDLEVSLATKLILSIALLLMPLLALAHMLKNNIKGRSKIMWLLIVIFLPFFGAVLYFIMRKRYRKYNPE